MQTCIYLYVDGETRARVARSPRAFDKLVAEFGGKIHTFHAEPLVGRPETFIRNPDGTYRKVK